ncbi:MAG: iron-containing alcohol dehydrogenase [Desulfosarcina sp.]|nr:iron-containing alcohol dehydrogenase [Desulfosarcina sp.]MBC2742274.1 iron-containing alcohol dehydrogenase [Desulfosarcina sp.]MBC2765185.1 iron-containing alcohol dehydrogenase [Desulfosarcina sp.]
MRLPEEFSFSCPLKINCGSRALAHLPIELSAVNANAPLILANHDQIGKKRVNTIVDAFKTSGLTLGIYDRLPDQPEPGLTPVLSRMYRDGGCDSIIAVGSGSVVDAAKYLNLMVSIGENGELDDSGRKMADPGPLRPLMLVATAGGNGDEVTGYASDGVRRLCSPRLVPDVAFIDPAMMGDQNDSDVVNGALIALVHAVEAFLDDSAGPMCRAYAHTAIDLIMENLPNALRKKDRKKSLSAVVNGQVAAGCAFFASSPGICHALAIQLKKWTELPLGFLMAILLPHLLGEAGAVQTERVGDLLYPIVGADMFAVTADDLKTPRTIALFWEFFDAINAELELKIPSSLSDAGLTDEQIKRVQSRVGSGPLEDHVARIIDGAREGATMMAG